MPVRRDFKKIMTKFLLILIGCLVLALPLPGDAQQSQPPKAQIEKTTPARPAAPPKTEQPPQEASQNPREEERSPRTTATGEEEKEPSREQHFDMTEVAPIVTHHQMQVNGRGLNYTATAGHMPITNATGKTEATMSYAAYSYDT